MPIVEINLWEGKTDNSVKERLIKEISEKVSEIVGAPIEAVEIMINEVPRENWGRGGVQSSKLKI